MKNKKYLLTILFIPGYLSIANGQMTEKKILDEMTVYFSELIRTTYQHEDSSFIYFIKDYIELFEEGETTEIASKIEVEKVKKINWKLKKSVGIEYLFRDDTKKDFENKKGLPDSIFIDFIYKYKYNVVNPSDNFLQYYFKDNKSVSADFVRQRLRAMGELSPLIYSQFLLNEPDELKYKKNEELFVLLFWPYISHVSGLEFFK